MILVDNFKLYQSSLVALLNKHAPRKCKSLHLRPANHWFTPTLSYLFQLFVQWLKTWMELREVATSPILQCIVVHRVMEAV